jgi:dTDP-4-amino-4,6-dideoxygalactose transaminase
MALTQSGRTAVALLAEATGLHAGDEVLMSAYNCGTEIDALLAAGLQVRCVDCDENGFVSRQGLEAGMNSRTRAIYIIHPFGWPQPLDEIDAWRKKLGLLLLEDCALALFSSYPDGTPIGTRGEASIFSFPKSLACPDGGALTWTTDWDGAGELARPPKIRTARQLASRGKAWIARHYRPVGSIPPGMAKSGGTEPAAVGDMPASYYFEPWRDRRTCSRATAHLLAHCSPGGIRERRRTNYRRLSQLLGEKNHRLLFRDLPDGVCPLNCPIRVEGRDELVNALQRCGIETSPWWAGGHRSVDWSLYPNAVKLKNTILPLPVHHLLNESDMPYIATTLTALST